MAKQKLSEKLPLLHWRTPYILVCRASGPYDGCFWEYNYWLQKNRKFYPLHVSGYVLKLFISPDVSVEDYSRQKNGVREHIFLEWADSTNRYSDWTIEKIEECCVAYNKLNSITTLLHYHELEGPQWDCSICEETHTGLAKFLGYEGNGGVGINLTDPCCTSCFDEAEYCEGCWSTVTPDEKGLCPNCGEETEFGNEDLQDEAENFGMDGSKTLSALEVYEPPLSVKLSEV